MQHAIALQDYGEYGRARLDQYELEDALLHAAKEYSNYST